MPLTLKNSQVAAKYTTDRSTDPVVHVCGIWKGPLSEIPLDAADELIKQQSNLLQLKDQDAAPPGPKKDTKPPTASQ